MNSKATVYDCTVIAETEKALLVEMDGEEKWIPKAAIHDDSPVFEKGHEGELVLHGWFARKIGVEED